MVNIFKNSNYQISDIYENCIVNGDIHILRNTNSLSQIINYSKTNIFLFNILLTVKKID